MPLANVLGYIHLLHSLPSAKLFGQANLEVSLRVVPKNPDSLNLLSFFYVNQNNVSGTVLSAKCISPCKCDFYSKFIVNFS